jgi:hypothetical protein
VTEAREGGKLNGDPDDRRTFTEAGKAEFVRIAQHGYPETAERPLDRARRAYGLPPGTPVQDAFFMAADRGDISREQQHARQRATDDLAVTSTRTADASLSTSGDYADTRGWVRRGPRSPPHHRVQSTHHRSTDPHTARSGLDGRQKLTWIPQLLDFLLQVFEHNE